MEEDENSKHFAKCIEFEHACLWKGTEWHCICEYSDLIKEYKRYKKVKRLRRFKFENKRGSHGDE